MSNYFRPRPVGIRVIESCEELAALPPESVVKEQLTAMSFVYWNGGDDTWCIPADDTDYRASDIALPAILLWEPSMSEEWNPNDGGDDEFREGDEEVEWKPLGLISEDGLTA